MSYPTPTHSTPHEVKAVHVCTKVLQLCLYMLPSGNVFKADGGNPSVDVLAADCHADNASQTFDSLRLPQGVLEQSSAQTYNLFQLPKNKP